ncbi:MAG: lysoplasmalogenase [Paracoccaceae bacterium]
MPLSYPMLILAALLAVIYEVGFAARQDKGWLGSAVKTGSVAALAAAGVMAGVSGLIVAGLILGALGDFALSRPGTSAFLAGMAAFAIGHLAYALAFAGRGVALWPDPFPLWQTVALIALGASTEGWLAPRTGELRGPVRAYVGVIVVMGVAALLLPTAPGVELAMVGAGLFILSDLLLALEMFVVTTPRSRRWLAFALWPAYWGGQMLILLGAAAASGGMFLLGKG